MENADNLPAPSDSGNDPFLRPGNSGGPGRKEHARASIMITQEFGGPLPPPSILHGYDEIIPGSAAQFVQAFHDEMEHRRDLEKRSIEAEILDRQASRQERKRGQQCGFIICMTAIIAGAVTAGLAPSVAGQIMGGVIGAGGLTSLVLAFITGRGFAKAEPKDKPKSQPSKRTNRARRKK